MSGQGMSVLEKAQVLAVRARSHSEGAQERGERARVGTALADLDRQLTALSGAVDAYGAARDAGVPLTELDAPADLVNPSSGYLPSPQALVAARQRAAKLTKRAEELVREAWSAWARTKLEAANPGRISRLGITHRQRAEDLQRRLRAAATTKEPEARQIIEFARDIQSLAGLLAGISEDDPVMLILNRIRRTPTTLADLTDEEMTLLRGDATAACQVVLSTT